MKRIATLILIGAASAAVFTGCKKEKTMMAEPQYNTAQKNVTKTNAPAEMPNVADIGYTIKITAPAATNPLQWKAGYMTIGNLTFNANVRVEQDMTRPRYSLQVNKTVTLLENGLPGGPVFLGTMMIPSGNYTAQEFRIVLGQGNTVSTAQNPRLMLAGEFVKNGRTLPVNIMVNQAVQIPAGYSQNFVMPGMQPHYVAELMMDLNALAKGINAELLDAATVTNNAIVISESQNQNLYQMVRENLYGSLHIKMVDVAGGTVANAPNPVM